MDPHDSITIVEYGDSLNFVLKGFVGENDEWYQRFDGGQSRDIVVDIAGVRIRFNQFDFFDLVPNEISIEDSRDSLFLKYSFGAEYEQCDSIPFFKKTGFHLLESAFSHHGVGNLVNYYPNGQVCFESETRNGNLHGKAYNYYDDGTLKKIESWRDGKVDGLQLTFNRDGILVNQKSFKMSVADGLHVYYNDKGELIKMEKWVNGLLVQLQEE